MRRGQERMTQAQVPRQDRERRRSVVPVIARFQQQQQNPEGGGKRHKKTKRKKERNAANGVGKKGAANAKHHEGEQVNVKLKIE